MFWQSLATILFVAIAAFVVGRRIWTAVRHRSGSPYGGCGGCGGCSNKNNAPQMQATPLIQLGQSLELPKSATTKSAISDFMPPSTEV